MKAGTPQNDAKETATICWLYADYLYIFELIFRLGIRGFFRAKQSGISSKEASYAEATYQLEYI